LPEPGGQLPAPDGLRRRSHQPAQPKHRTEAGLQVGQVAGELVDLAHEHRGDQVERDQGGGGETAVEDQGDTDQRGGCQHAVEQGAGASADPGLDLDHATEAAVDLGGQLGAAPQHVGLAKARAQVVARCHALLHGGRVVGPRHLLEHLALSDLGQQATRDHHGRDAGQREQQERRPPRQPGHQPERTSGQDRAGDHPYVLAQQHPDLVGVVVDAVEHLAHGLLAQLGQRLLHRRVEQVGAQPALRAVDQPGPQRAAEGVEHGCPDDAQSQQSDELAGGVLSQATGDDRPGRHPDRSDQGAGQGDHGQGAAHPPPVDGDAAGRHRGIGGGGG